MITIKRLAVLFAVVFISSCQQNGFLDGSGQLNISASSNGYFRQYLNYDKPLAFAVSTDGRRVGWTQCESSSCSQAQAAYKAISFCEASDTTGRTRCKIYARGKKVVWKGPVKVVLAQDLPPSKPAAVNKFPPPSAARQEVTLSANRVVPTQGISRLQNVFPTSPVDVSFRPQAPRPDDVAVIIGNANYGKGKDIPDVTPAYADANGFKRYAVEALGIRPDNIIFLKDATQSDMISTFGSDSNHKGRLFRYLVKGKSRVFIYYAGHGAPGTDGSNYLVPVNAEASLIELNGYPLETLYKNLSKLPAESVTVVLEACFSGASEAGTVISNASPVYLKAKTPRIPANVTVIAAGASNQIASWEKDRSHSLFSKYFLRGMSGEADSNKDGTVSWDELKEYLSSTVSRLAMRYYGRDQAAQIVIGGNT